jgi:hypothetical protein
MSLHENNLVYTILIGGKAFENLEDLEKKKRLRLVERLKNMPVEVNGCWLCFEEVTLNGNVYFNFKGYVK